MSYMALTILGTDVASVTVFVSVVEALHVISKACEYTPCLTDVASVVMSVTVVDKLPKGIQ